MIDYAEIGQRLAVAVKESPGNSEQDPALRDFYRKTNGQRIWEIWTQCKMHDEKDYQFIFSSYSGLPVGVVNRYLEVCRKYEEERAMARIQRSRAKTRASKAKTKN